VRKDHRHNYIKRFYNRFQMVRVLLYRPQCDISTRAGIYEAWLWKYSAGGFPGGLHGGDCHLRPEGAVYVWPVWMGQDKIEIANAA
jgi:hypothetical protein